MLKFERLGKIGSDYINGNIDKEVFATNTAKIKGKIPMPHQSDATEKVNKNTKGIVCMPTGSGKTLVQINSIMNDIKENPGFGIYTILDPKIVLSQQLLFDYYEEFMDKGIDVRYFSVHSGGNADINILEELRIGSGISASDVGSGTSAENIQEAIQNAYAENIPILLFSTYHSATRIEDARRMFNPFVPIRIIINDEAHHLIKDQFHDIINTLDHERCFFYTATMKDTPSDEGRGMNNTDYYGDVLYEMIPRKAIDLGLSVRPKILIAVTDGVFNRDDYERSKNRIIEQSFNEHSELLPDGISKILVATNGLGDIREFINSPEYHRLRDNDVNIFAVASDNSIGHHINGIDVGNRQHFLRELKRIGENPNEKMLILHYDILTEGIDVPGINGILLLRMLTKSAFLQTFGRASRITPHDREQIKNGNIDPKNAADLAKMQKPYAYVIIPFVIQDNSDDYIHIRDLIYELRGFDFNPREDIIGETLINGIPDDDVMDRIVELDIHNQHFGRMIRNIELDIESDKLANLNNSDKIKSIMNRIIKTFSNEN